MSSSWCLSSVENLSRVHDPLGVQCGLDAPHDGDAGGAELRLQVAPLAHAHAVLAGAGAAPADRPVRQPEADSDL